MLRNGLLVLVALVLVPSVRGQPVTVTGHLLGQDGTPMTQAHVKLTTAGGDEMTIRRADADGFFSLDVDTTGIFRLLLAGVAHRAHVAPIFLYPAADTVRLDVRLGRYVWRDDLTEAVVVGDFNGYSHRSGAIALERQSNGTYAATVPSDADTVAYQLVGVIRGTSASVDGGRADRHVFDYTGSYRSVVDVENGHARIVVSPPQAQHPARPAVVAYADTAGAAARFARLVDVLDAHGDEYERGYRALRRGGANAEQRVSYREQFDWTTSTEALRSALDDADGRMLRDALYVAYFTRTLRPDTTVARQALEEIPVTTAAWGAAPTALGRALEGAGDERAEPYAERARHAHPSVDVRAYLLYRQLVDATDAGDDDGARAAFARLRSAFPEHPYTSVAKARYAPDRPMQVGATVPAFAVEGLGDTTTVYTDATFTGQTVLIDFWATWCGPCLRELPFLHAAAERFEPNGLRILSLSFDDRAETVSTFREEGEWPMPWLHGHIEGGFDSDLADAFGVTGIPAPVLVGPDGTILATRVELRGDLLEETLERHLDDDRPPDAGPTVE